jgi:hypothetical protein
MSQLRSFAPWLVAPIATAIFDWRVGSALAFGLALAGVLRGGRTATTDMFAVVAALYFAALAAVAFTAPASGLHRFVPAFSGGALAVAAALSIVVGRPFTVAFAKRVAPPEYWDTPMFAHVNVVLTEVWATSFALTAAVTGFVLATDPHAALIMIGAQVAGFVVPMRICRLYPAAVRARHAATA